MKQLKEMKSIVVRGKRYRLVVKKLKDARGMCEPPDTKDKTVFIDSREEGKELLATLIDEMLHCALWEIENEVVDEISDDMANILWRAGLRFEEEMED